MAGVVDPMAPGAATATGVLRDEHRIILDVVGVLERVLDGADQSHSPDGAAIADCLTFFRLFTDACHHSQEEDVLFEELVERGLSRTEGPIAVMLLEHEQGRAFVRAMTTAFDAASGGRSSDWTDFERSARDYIALIRGHIMKEDGILFEMADGLISGRACRAMCERYHPACLERLQGRTKRELEALAAALVERCPPG